MTSIIENQFGSIPRRSITKLFITKRRKEMCIQFSLVEVKLMIKSVGGNVVGFEKDKYLVGGILMSLKIFMIKQ